MITGEIKIRNLDGCERADIPLADKKICLIGGRNNQGKSSILTGCIAALCATKTPRGGTANDGKHIKKGADKAAALFTWGDDDRRMICWAPKTSEIEGEAPIISAYAAGTKQLSSLEGKERAAELLRLIKALPTMEDFKKAVIDTGLFAADLNFEGEWMPGTKPAKAWANLELGWDRACSDENDAGKYEKRKFQEITGMEWGTAQLPKFQPEGIDSVQESDTLDSLRAQISEWAALREQALKSEAAQQAVQAYDRAALKARAAQWAELDKRQLGLQEDKAHYEQQLATTRALLSTNQAKLTQLMAPPPEPTKVILLHPGAQVCTCAECGETLYLNCKKADKSHYTTKTPPKKENGPLPPADRSVMPAVNKNPDIEKLKAEIAGIQQRIQNYEIGRDDMIGMIAANAAALKAALDAQQNLLKLNQESQQIPIADELLQGSDEIGTEISILERAWTALNKRIQAIACDALIRQSVALQHILGADGLRKKKLAAALADFNLKYLQPQANTTGWQLVEIQPDFSITYAGRDFARISRSERWRCNLMLQVAIAQLEGDGIVLIDDAEILVGREQRGKIINLLIKTGLAGIVVMACHSREDLPDLAVHNAGWTYFVENGVAECISKTASLASK